MFYYSSDGEIFDSKIKALQSNKKVYLYYYDHIYDKLNWKIEPVESLDNLYKQQAERLREKYDHLILCYSGGYDSTNILETFYYNNIKLDKIVIVGAFSQDSFSGDDHNHNGELYKNAYPLIDKLNLSNITEVHDYTKKFNDPKNFSLITNYDTEWYHKIGSYFSPHHWFWNDLEKHIIPSHYTGKVGIIFGKDKPHLKDNKFHFYDGSITAYGNVLGTENSDRINFYWDPTFPDILLKQLHILKRLNVSKEFKFDDYFQSQIVEDLNINEIVYNLKNPLNYKSPKSKTNILSLRDSYLIGKKDSEIYQLFKKSMEELNKKVNIHEIKSINTKQYEI